ncbi:MAG: cell division protein FtsB [Piscirickettsiaceae bacterium]|nr:MAG: cell division protein FtsB [Piscirickettsiaceae bacterium]
MKTLVAILIILLVFLQYKLWIAEGNVQDLWALEGRIESLMVENKTLSKRNKALQAEVENLKTGLDVVEEKARRDLGLVGKDETFFQIVNP